MAIEVDGSTKERMDQLVWDEEVGKGFLQVIPRERRVCYWKTYEKYEDSPVGPQLKKIRRAWVNKYVPLPMPVLDIGIGNGAFIRTRGLCFGYDTDPTAIRWLREKDLFMNPYGRIPPDVKGITFFDSLEHIEKPEEILRNVDDGVFVFVAIPIFAGLKEVLESKHFKPREHYHYFTSWGLLRFFSGLGFELTEANREEQNVGRESIGSFVFQRK